MEFTFLICTIVGGTVLACQLVMTIAGLGDDGLDVDDLPDDGADHGHEDSSWLFGIISFKTIVAALTFFGLTGMASLRGGLSPVTTIALAVAAGFAAMVGVHRLMLLLSQLQEEGTFRIDSALGQRATVYVPIPGERAGAGKVQLRTDDRIVELKALTGSHERLATGTRVEIVEIISGDTIGVEPLVDSTAETA
jgi:membrane protein implicated in regulation of membrane protease activity